MRKITILSILCFIAINASAQFHISTNLRMNFSWDDEKEDWKFESQDEESLTFFEFNKDFTLVKHTTSTITSAYLIKSSEHDESDDRNQYIYMVTSDVGNKYMMIVDIKNSNLRFV